MFAITIKSQESVQVFMPYENYRLAENALLTKGWEAIEQEDSFTKGPEGMKLMAQILPVRDPKNLF